MKKTLATLLVVALVASLCGVMFVSAEATNLVAGKTYEISEQFHMSNVTWGYDETFPASYPDDNYELTDGLLPEPGYAEAGWMAFNQQTPAQAERGYAYVNFDLGAVCDLDELTYVTYKDLGSGIQAPHTVEVWVSNDGETYEQAGAKTYEGDEHANMTDLALATEKIALDVSAQYVQLRTISYGWCFLAEVEILGTAAATEEPDAPATGKNWENTMVEGENGNYSCEVPYGYTWNVNYVDGTIGGEDVTVCTTQAAYDVCNPNWAITVYLEKQADGTYVALQDAIVTPGSAAAAGITIGENQIALVAHSAYSNPNGSNWQGKVVAMSVKAGDVFEVADDFSTVVAVDPNAAPETPDTPDVPVVKETIAIDGKLDDDGYDKAVWFSDGIWQGLNDPQIADLDIAYTVRSDDDNIYLAIKVNQGVDFEKALDPAAWDQSGATNFRIWLLGDGMETRTFYDLLWDGEAFIPHRQKTATDELTFAAGIGDDYINMEIAIAKSSLNITDSFKLMVTYSTPHCGEGDNVKYNAFHMTACDEMPSGWSGNADAYESYNCGDIALGTKVPATGDESVLVFAVLGLLAIAGAAVAIKVKG